MAPNPGDKDNCKIKVAVRVRPFNRRGKKVFFSLSTSESPSLNRNKVHSKYNCKLIMKKISGTYKHD